MKFKSFIFGGEIGGYEYECGIQAMLFRGIEALRDWPDFDWNYLEYEGIVGVCFPIGEDARKLDRIIAKDIPVSGAQHQVVVHNLMYIHHFGYEKWLQFGIDSGDAVVEFDSDAVIADARQADPVMKEMMTMYATKPPQNIITAIDPSQYPEAFAELARRIKEIRGGSEG